MLVCINACMYVYMSTGAVWLNKDLLSEFDYWQFWRNTADADVLRFLKLFTELPLETIESFSSVGMPVLEYFEDSKTILL